MILPTPQRALVSVIEQRVYAAVSAAYRLADELSG